jgi:predicted metalloprotease with PDZ domain
MKKIVLSSFIALSLLACNSAKVGNSSAKEVNVSIDLVNIKDDRVQVTAYAPIITEETTTYSIPKIIPGTYSEDNYGKYVENFKAFCKKGNPLTVIKLDENTFEIKDAKILGKVVYEVNDTYDSESGAGFGEGEDVFSPAGTNINAGKNFMLNTHAFVGYFKDKKEIPYKVTVLHPENMVGATSLVDTDASNGKDVFMASRYAELVDNPMMYTIPDITSFNVEGMDIVISVYSANGKYKAADITPDTEKFMRAQKKFLGKFNANKKYTVLLYLSDTKTKDAKGFGALEHMTSTTVVMPENMPLDALKESLKDVVSHEFFHIVTPLSVHSREIHYFDFNQPKMSQHLWMYEGITEYFANLFQINQGLITEEQFYERMQGKIDQAAQMNDKMSFTKMSKNVLEKPFKDQYINVYQKGALIAMCLDIQLREASNGQKGILNLMQDLANKFGSDKPFDDEELFPTIVSLTNANIGKFFETHVIGETPIDYSEYFKKMGVSQVNVETTGNPFLKNMRIPLIGFDQATKEIKAPKDITKNVFLENLGVKSGEVLLGFNDEKYNLDSIYELITASETWKDGDAISVLVKRDGKEVKLTGKVVLPKETKSGYQATDASKNAIKNAWLKG